MWLFKTDLTERVAFTSKCSNLIQVVFHLTHVVYISSEVLWQILFCSCDALGILVGCNIQVDAYYNN